MENTLLIELISERHHLDHGVYAWHQPYPTRWLWFRGSGKLIESNSPKTIHRKQLIDRKVYRTENLSNGNFIERKVYRAENLSNRKLIERKIDRMKWIISSSGFFSLTHMHFPIAFAFSGNAYFDHICGKNYVHIVLNMICLLSQS